MSTSEVETLLTLSDGRTLAYAHNGNPASSLVVVFLHGFMGVGRARRLSPIFKAHDVHNIAPTLSGWGNSSPRPSNMSYAAALLADLTELITHLHPNDEDLRIYISGGSYGTVPAQIVYGAPFDQFPLGRKVVGCVLLAPFSPFRWHKDYAKAMTWPNYISVGPLLIKWKMSSVEKAERFIRAELFDKAQQDERDAFAKWRAAEGVAEGELEREIATGAFLSMSNTTVGFSEGAGVIRSDWGFRPDQLDDEHVEGRPMLIVASKHDALGPDMANWLQQNYRNSRLKWVSGGHVSALYEMDAIWREMLGDPPNAERT
ncbi:alpha/beta-hydrolase [Hymenopellis radicata]|nr:alpha/beta-hydrolase [Hymenopellis radicata]